MNSNSSISFPSKKFSNDKPLDKIKKGYYLSDPSILNPFIEYSFLNKSKIEINKIIINSIDYNTIKLKESLKVPKKNIKIDKIGIPNQLSIRINEKLLNNINYTSNPTIYEFEHSIQCESIGIQLNDKNNFNFNFLIFIFFKIFFNFF